MTTTYHRQAPKGLATLVRNEYWHGRLLGAQDLQREQDYVRNLQQAMARLTVGCGVLCGLAVTRAGATGIAVGAGAAIDGEGRLIIVPRDHEFDDIEPWMCGAEPGTPGTYELCLIHHDCPTMPAPALVTDCDTRLECKPGAMEERYRFEARWVDARRDCPERCPSCDRGLEPGRPCPCECTECVPLAQFEWTGTEITDLTMAHRVEVPSNRDLHRMLECTCGTCDPTAVVAPRLVGMWPAPGETLAREGSPSDWARWRFRPRVELTFDRPVDAERVDDLDDWVRAWAIFEEGGEARCERIRLRHADEVDGKACGGHTVVVDFVDFSADIPAGDGQAGPAVTVLVQAISNDDTGPAAAAPVRLPGHMEFAGTTLDRAQLAELWRGDDCQPGPVGELVPDPLPDCFSDGYDGGHLHAAFFVAPVEEAARVTAVYPHNGERVASRDMPPIEISMAAPVPDGLQPRAWLIAGGAHHELQLTRTQNGPDRPLALRRFEGSFDGTLAQELAHTARWEVAATGEQAGRVLVVAAAEVAGASLGGFAGTCLSDVEVAEILERGPTAQSYDGVRPSMRRMPRSGEGGRWIHWTYAWEGSRS